MCPSSLLPMLPDRLRPHPGGLPRIFTLKQIKMMSLGIRFGSLSEACLAVLLLPILRRMALLRIVGIQFEASVRYHMWIANGMLFFSLLHGATIMAVWCQKSSLLEEITKWQRVGCVYLAGAIALVTGIIIWITALPPIRRKYFQFFYAAHNLYLVFILFFLLHAGDRHFYLVFSGVLLFALDKALRLIQSRRAICLLSARLLPCKAVELTLKKPPTLKYTPTSILFMKIPCISKFQWHPFSIISSSDVDHEQFSIIVKSQGKWTNSLYEMIEFMANNVSDDARSIPVSVEGPYGPANFSYNRFDRLMLIAAGSGIAPFISILQDAFGRDRILNPFPTRVLLIYIVKKSHDLSMLTPISTLLLDQTPPITQNLQLKLKIYVTQEQKSRLSARELINLMTQSKPFILKPIPSGDIMPVPEGLMWNFTITILASAVFLISILCLTRAFIHEGKKPYKDKTPSWVSDLLLICSLAITTTIIIMATIISGWLPSPDNYSKFSRKNRNRNTAIEANFPAAQAMQQEHEISFGSRPILTDVLSEEPVDSEETKVGVFACGPGSLQASVASFCKNYSKGAMLRKDGRKHGCLFVYHSINFTL
ncbi:hypothetical protein KSP40_PGU006700 [Platanthera guangdongensis]|uniref:FAD-binding FR-type domain-containing protein n=1 Tax=Platanthera guangdongensis TaxID=2320717 RepID=A0ABR2M7P3_9ASPA